MTLSRRGRHYLAQVACIICEENHILTFSAQEFLITDCLAVYCTESEVELGHFGKRSAVEKVIKEDPLLLENIVRAGDGFFYRAEIVQGILARIQALAEIGRLHCECGNEELSVTLHPDRIELLCPDCGNFLEVFAETDDDLEVVRLLPELSLDRKTTTLDGTRLFADRKG